MGKLTNVAVVLVALGMGVLGAVAIYGVLGLGLWTLLRTIDGPEISVVWCAVIVALVNLLSAATGGVIAWILQKSKSVGEK